MKDLFFLIASCLLFKAAHAQNTTVFYQSLEWSPNSKTICFAAIIKDSGKYDKTKWELYSVNTDGTNLTRLTKNSAIDVWCSFSPDGKKITFQSDRDGNPEIYTMKADGTNVERITNNPSRESYPVCRPDGKKIIFTSDRDGNEELYQMNVDGSQQERLTQTSGNELDPSYSHDGKKIVYFYEKGDHHDQVYVADANGANSINISNDTLNNIYPSWFGDKIIYASTHENDKTIFVSDAGGNKKQIVENAFYARLSPDGKKVAYISGDWNNTIIYVSNSDGTDKKILIKLEDLLKL